ncbi:MAG: tripartite tricarboxylate transporter substrate binding protein [Betaproteobacteria bacterium]|nr:tripartite tricarboxylate transporter substrate binding protein [Betaproteobacteria bacterium]
MRIPLHGTLAAAMLTALPALAQQPAYPNRPIRVISGFPPGSSVDVLGRFMAIRMSERLGQQLVIDNRPGASGTIGADIAARATPDGYTLFIMTASQILSVPLIKKLPYDPVKSFSAISPIGMGPLMLVSNPSFAPKTVKDLIELAKSKPGGLTYSSAGNGSINHYAGALFDHATGARLLHVPHKGGAPAFLAAMTGEVNLMFATLPLSLNQIRAGKVKPYGITALKRSPLVPNIAPLAETVPGFEVITWWSFVGPAGLPAPVLKRLNAEIVGILTQPDSAQRLAAEGAEPWPLSSEAFAKILNSELEKWTRIARDIGIHAQ